jgi:hypothetical protein
LKALGKQLNWDQFLTDQIGLVSAEVADRIDMVKGKYKNTGSTRELVRFAKKKKHYSVLFCFVLFTFSEPFQKFVSCLHD